MKNYSKLALKYWKYAIFFLLVLAFLAGCGNPQIEKQETPTIEISDTPRKTSTPTPDDVTPAPTEDQPSMDVNMEDLDGLSIRFVHPWSGEIGEEIQDIAMKFSLSNPWGLWIEVEGAGSEDVLYENIQSGLDQGDVPELIAAHAYTLSWLEGEYQSILLTDYLDHPDWGIDPASQEDIPSPYLDQYTVDGQLIALPVAPQAAVLFYNQTWGELLGFESHPTDADSFSEQVCGGTAANLVDDNEENDFTGGWLMNFDPWILFSWYTAFGGEMSEGAIPQFNNEAGQSAFSFLETLFSPENNCIWIGRQAEPYWYFANRYTLMYAGTLDQIPAQVGWMEQNQNNDQWMVTGFPGPEGEVVLVDSPGLFVTDGEPEEELGAWLFARYLLTPEVQGRLVQKMFTLPVRLSAMDGLSDFTAAYPQWEEAVNRLENVKHLPISEGWGYGRWMLQDAIRRSFAVEDEEIQIILEQLDETIIEFEGDTP